MQTIVFLDFDDVLAVHPEHTSQHVVAALRSGSPDQFAELWANVFHEAACKNLRALYDEFTPHFVISSSWATYLSRGEVGDVLVRGGLDFVAAALHSDWRSATDVGSFRATEINSWLKRQGGPQGFAYVILDDTASGHTLYGTLLKAQTVFCDEWQGFLDIRLAEAQKILRHQLS
ncbi:HAD domain-containing protein [Rugamonas sp.]|uniref:HAD domain-containing protein n=1 Tax=Rugamonas sp. TaxID=1926287 RepID=UPI0025DE14D5|nr:HAD domain-containing protein [Rugamonas sp.]